VTVSSSESGEGVTAAPTCYRHPGRETYIRCSRCERPICPDCMRDAPVGFQCPECVRSGAVRTRTSVGATVARRPDAVTLTLIAINFVAFLLKLSSPAFERRLFEYNFVIAHQHEYYRFITSSFLHVGWLHIALNMYALYLMGPPLERLLGWWRFLGLYLVAGLTGGVAAYVLTNQFAVVEGASGSIFGLFAAMWVLNRRFGADTSQITTLIAINFALSFFLARISWQGHLGGFIGGGLIALVYAYAPRRTQSLAHVGALVAVAALAMVAALLRTAALT
jgi:membrane associated rhomboid family serine protease